MNSTNAILFFYEGIGKRVGLLSSTVHVIPFLIEERTHVQNRINTYQRYYMCIPVFDYDEKKIKLLAGLIHHPIVAKVAHFYQTVPTVWKSHDLYIRVQYKEWTFEKPSTLDVHIHLVTKIPGMPCLFEPPSLEEMKTAIIAWRESLGETIRS